MLRKILRSPFKNSPLDCFLTAFDSPHFIQRKNNKGALKEHSLAIFLVDPRGIEPLSENLLI